jgi:hypothetical protein
MTTDERLSYTFDLAEEMVDEIHEEFSPTRAVEELRKVTEGKSADEIDEIGRQHFADYGRRLMERTLVLGDEYPDRTYAVMLASEEHTGNDGWPFLAQRPMEVAILSSQPVYTLPIVENSAYRFTWKLAFCETYEQMQEQFGAGVAERLPCQAGCVATTKRAFAEFGFDVEVNIEGRMPDDEFCQFMSPRVPRRTEG